MTLAACLTLALAVTLVVGRDDYCMGYIRAFREGLLE